MGVAPDFGGFVLEGDSAQHGEQEAKFDDVPAVDGGAEAVDGFFPELELFDDDALFGGEFVVGVVVEGKVCVDSTHFPFAVLVQLLGC
jgi:hypothetical protein